MNTARLPEKLSLRARKIFDEAEALARLSSANTVEPSHLLSAILSEDGVDEVLGADIGRTESACGKECCREDILRSGREGK